MPSEWCAATVIATDESMRVSSSIAIAYDERVGAAAAVLLRDRHAHQAELGQLGDELVREPLLAVELLGDRRDLLERELPDGVAEQLVLASRSKFTPAPQLGTHRGAMVPRSKGLRVETPFRGMRERWQQPIGLSENDVCGA